METPEIKAKKELYLYTPIWDEVAAELVEEINEFEDGDALTLRMNTPGGNVIDGYAILSRLSDRTGETTIFVDGYAYSMGAFMCLWANNVVASEMSDFMFHKASYPEWYQSSEQEQAKLKEMNAKFKAKMKSRFNDSALSKEIIAKVFESDVRNDVFVSPKDAKAIGLVTEIRTLDLGVKAKLETAMQIYATFQGKQNSITQNDTNGTPNGSGVIKNNVKMTIEQFKAEHPSLYAQVVEEGKQAGINAERDRVGSFLVFAETSPELVKAGIESGKAMSETQRSEFAMASFKIKANATEQTENPKPIETDDADKGETEAKRMSAEIEASLSNVGLTLKSK